ncbi:hypothetical protein BB561_000196 [Smittium simulii]|uniref:Uncharacterized protein n=1 Tax=Smittium simulii TaxID=133385 RepID=A0A2T9Y4C0_9FUNG|nr:hypothetical protein BB561_006442 [Smittium simulii]PVU97934.1 hypothetical protein BB561_000196 [Smittium simulii]
MIQHSQTHTSHGKIFGACFITNEKTNTRGKRRPKGIKTMDTFYKNKRLNNSDQTKLNVTPEDQKTFQDYKYFSLTLKPILIEDTKNSQEKSKKSHKAQKNVFKIINYNNSISASSDNSSQMQRDCRYSEFDNEIPLFQ